MRMGILQVVTWAPPLPTPPSSPFPSFLPLAPPTSPSGAAGVWDGRRSTIQWKKRMRWMSWHLIRMWSAGKEYAMEFEGTRALEQSTCMKQANAQRYHVHIDSPTLYGRCSWHEGGTATWDGEGNFVPGLSRSACRSASAQQRRSGLKKCALPLASLPNLQSTQLQSV